MTILFLGEESIQNSAVQKVLEKHSKTSKWTVKHRTFSDLEDYRESSSEDPFSCVLFDLSSHSGDSEKAIKLISEKNITDNLLLIHNGEDKALLDRLMSIGVDGYIPISSNVETFIGTLENYR